METNRADAAGTAVLAVLERLVRSCKGCANDHIHWPAPCRSRGTIGPTTMLLLVGLLPLMPALLSGMSLCQTFLPLCQFLLQYRRPQRYADCASVSGMNLCQTLPLLCRL